MKKIVTSLLFIIGMSLVGFSQPYHEWSIGVGGTGLDQGRSITSDVNGNVYVLGYFAGTVDFDPGPGVFNLTASGGLDVFVQKLNYAGDLVWVKRVGGVSSSSSVFGFSISLDYSNNLLIAGNFTGTVDFDPGVGVENLTSFGNTDGYVLKLDNSGNYLWSKQFGGTLQDAVRSVSSDQNNNVIIGGEFKGTGDFDPGTGTFNIISAGATDFFIVKLSSLGNLEWAHGGGSTGDDWIRAVSVDANDNILLTGAFRNTVDFNYDIGTNNLTSSGSGSSTDAFIQKLDPSGVFIWVKKMGGTSNDGALTLSVNSFDEVIVGGYFSGSGSFGGTYLSSAGAKDIFIAKYDSNGTAIWGKRIGGPSNEELRGVTSNMNGAIYLTGIFQSTVDFDPNAGVFNMSGGQFTEDAFISKLDINGSFEWAVQMSTNGGDESGSSITTSGTNIFCTGYFNASLDLDPTSGTNLTSSNGGFDSFVIKLNECLSTSSSINVTRCDSYISPSGNYTWTTSDTYLDIIQNAAGCDSVITINLTIEDNLAPVADIATLSNITSECSVTSLTAPTATDNCAGSITGTHNTSLPITTQGTTVVTWTYDDGNGNTSIQTQNVVINDVTAPVADLGSLSDVSSECEITSLIAPTATDNCVGSVTGTHNASLPITTQGTTVVTWTYDDGNGNTFTQTQNVVIDDITTPITDVATLSNITSECSVTSLTAPTATDNCVGSVTGTHNVTLPITASGTTTVTWTYDDGNGNISTQTQDVIITPINNGVTQVDAVTLSADATGYNYQWIDCNNGNQAINGATNQTFVATANGNFAVEIDNGACTVTSNCTVINQVGISEIGDTDLVEVYPNPTTGTIYILSLVPFNQIEVMNALGQKIETNNISETSKYLLRLPEQNGVYFVKVYSDKVAIIKRIVKK